MKVAVLDIFFGDSGKGRITHDLSKDADWVIRFSGGNNCGHVIYRDEKKYTHNLLPSADYRIKTLKSFIGAGVMIHTESLLNEVKRNMQDYPDMPKSLYIDPDAFIVEQRHIDDDIALNGHLGSTKKGIGPATRDKWDRKGKRISDALKSKDPSLEELKDLGVNFKYNLQLKKEFESSNLVFEGAQGALLDIQAGTYPYVTSSDCTMAGIYQSGFQYIKLDKVYGITKAYATRVGEGVFPTEIFGQAAEDLRAKGKEIGATTGRPRRVGYLDLAACKYGAIKSGSTHIVVTKMDILQDYEDIQVCYDYEEPIYCGGDLNTAVPKYCTMQSWSSVTDPNFDKYIKLIEDCLELPVIMITHGISEGDVIIK